MEVEVKVIQGAAQAKEAVQMLAARPKVTIPIPRIFRPCFFVGAEPSCRAPGLKRGPDKGFS
jgi:hypothetical protein